MIRETTTPIETVLNEHKQIREDVLAQYQIVYAFSENAYEYSLVHGSLMPSDHISILICEYSYPIVPLRNSKTGTVTFVEELSEEDEESFMFS